MKGEWIKKMWHKYTVQYYSAIKKNERMPLAATWMELEVSETEKDKQVAFKSGVWINI